MTLGALKEENYIFSVRYCSIGWCYSLKSYLSHCVYAVLNSTKLKVRPCVSLARFVAGTVVHMKTRFKLQYVFPSCQTFGKLYSFFTKMCQFRITSLFVYFLLKIKCVCSIIHHVHLIWLRAR